MVFKANNKLIQNRFTFWSEKLKVNRDFIWTDNLKSWNNIIELGSFRTERCLLPFGATTVPKSPQAPIIFINKTRNNSKKELETTIVHELLHIKFPLKSEKQIINLTKRVMK